ncbi:MAG: MMPL family transporter, partial [Deltaproteobacteria bacterium]|nr:MMPL family transporter [Deltaproteobacteria bacterium]
MGSMIQRLNLYFEVLPERLSRWRWWVLLLYVILMTFLAAGIPRFAFTWANDDMFGKDDPVQISLDRIKDLFGGTVTLGMVYKPVDGDLFSERSLGALKNVHDVLAAEAERGADNPENSLRLLNEVESLFNTSFTEVDGDSIRFRDFIGEELPSSPEQSRLLREQALNEPEYPRVLVSENMEYGMLVLRTNLDAVPLRDDEFDELKGFEENELEGQDEHEPQFVDHGLEDYADFEKQVWSLLSEERFSKDLVFMHPSWGAFYQNDVWAVEYQRALLISLIVSLLLTWLLLGSLRAVIWPIVIFVSSIVGVLGLAGWTGWPIDLSLYIAFGLVSVAAIADVVHVLSGYLFFHQQGQHHSEVLRSVFSKTALACLLTSITTAIGVFSLFFIKLRVIQTMGLLGGIGVMFAFMLTIFLLPVLLNWFPPRPLKSNEKPKVTLLLGGVKSLLNGIERVSTDYPKGVIVFFAVAGMLLILGITRIEIDTVFSEYYPPESPVRRTISLMDEQFLGTGNMEILLETESAGVFRDPEVLLALEEVKQWIETKYPKLITHNWTLNNQLKQTHRKLNENREEFYNVPDNPELVSQLLVLIEGGDYENLERLVSLDYANARMSMSLKTIGSKKSVELLKVVQPGIEKILLPLKERYPELKVTLTGGVGAWARVFDAISWSQVYSFGLAFLIISLIMFGIFGSLKL